MRKSVCCCSTFVENYNRLLLIFERCSFLVSSKRLAVFLSVTRSYGQGKLTVYGRRRGKVDGEIARRGGDRRGGGGWLCYNLRWVLCCQSYTLVARTFKLIYFEN